MEVLSAAGTPRLGGEDQQEGEDDKEEPTKLDSGAGESDGSTVGKGEEEVRSETAPPPPTLDLAPLAAPTIAAGGTVFATAARKKSKSLYLSSNWT